MTYSQKKTIKVLKTQHVVTFREGQYAHCLHGDMAKVPFKAKLISVVQDDESGEYTLTFEEESEE